MMGILSKFDLSSTKMTNNRNRTLLTQWIVISGLFLITILAVMIIVLSDDDRYEASKWVFNAIIPLVASWIGTVIAFYFGRENYEAATEQVLALTRDTLDDLKVENIMINVKTIVAKKLKEEEYKQTELPKVIDLYKQIEKDRIPIFSADSKAKYIIHLATMIEYNSATKKKDNAGNELVLSIQDIIDDNPSRFSHKTKDGFITVSKNSSIKEALDKMNELDGCKDIFITQNGKNTEKVEGWLTDTLISRFLSV